MQVALYARVSTTRQADNDLSIPDQLRQLRDWAKANGHIVVSEFIEPGASATDDKRPIFQQMINDALQKPSVFDAIIIHSLSRFFRDGIQFGVYERRLIKNKVQIISITQPTSDDAGGEMMRRIINLFDEHQSKENAKHTLRAMKENARQGYFNGSTAPFGYTAVSTNVAGARGRQKKRLEINEVEADVVRLAYDLYMNGDQGKTLGCKEIAIHLTKKGFISKGKPWSMQKIHVLLSSSLYMGDYHFNVYDKRTGKNRPPEEWIKTPVPAIIDAATFESVRLKRESRSPDQTPPRRVSSPTLLTGLLKCGICGGHMTIATGKGGQYRYYKCTSRCNKGNTACTSANLPMERTDAQVLNQLVAKVFAPARLQTIMTEYRKRIDSTNNAQHEQVSQVNRQLKQIEERQQRLMDAIETGILDLDETTQRRAQQLKVSKEALIIELAKSRRQPEITIEPLRASQIDKLSAMLKNKLLSNETGMAKSYLNLLINEIVVTDNTANVKGSYSALAATASAKKIKKDTLNQVPTFIQDWCPEPESNRHTHKARDFKSLVSTNFTTRADGRLYIN